MAKRVRLSADGTNFFTLPGNTAELNNEAGDIDDTIFGQDYSSTQSGLINWTVSANSLYKGFAGYVAKILKTGTSTPFTTQAMSLVSGRTYRITDVTKNIWDRNTTLTVFDNAVAVNASNILNVDYLFGRVTFAAGYTVTGPVTVTGASLPKLVVGCVNSFTLTQTANPIDNTCMDTAQANSGRRTFEYGLKTVSLDLTGIYKVANGFIDLLESRAELVIEINPDGSNLTVGRGFFKPVTTGQSGDVGDLEQETITFNLSVPDNDILAYPFHWVHDVTSTLNQAVRIALDAWESNTFVDVQYLPDGTTGKQGEGIIVDMTLSGGLEAMNEFTVNIQGSGALTDVP